MRPLWVLRSDGVMEEKFRKGSSVMVESSSGSGVGG